MFSYVFGLLFPPQKQLGYCQAMNYIAGFLLVVMKREEMVFWTLVAIINNYLNEYFSCSLLGSLVDIKVTLS